MADRGAAGVLAAVERQLGLRFERRTEPMDVLVIDSVSMPEPDREATPRP